MPSAVVRVTDWVPRSGPRLTRVPALPASSVRSSAPKRVAPSKVRRGGAAVEGDEGLGEERRAGGLAGGAGGGGEDRGGADPQAREEVEPVDGEVPEDELFDLLEGGAGDPAMVPVDRDVGGVEGADQAGGGGFAHPGEMRRPAAVLVDGEDEIVGVGEVAEAGAGVEVEDEGLLREDVLTGGERGLDQGEAFGGVGGEVDDGDVVAGEGAGDVVGGLRRGEELVPAGDGAGEGAVGDDRDVEAGGAVGGEVGAGDAPGADQRDAGAGALREGRAVVEVGGGDLRGGGGLEGVGVEVGFGHGASGTVRPLLAERTALSMMRWPRSESAGSRGPVTGGRRRCGRGCRRRRRPGPGGAGRRRSGPARGRRGSAG